MNTQDQPQHRNGRARVQMRLATASAIVIGLALAGSAIFTIPVWTVGAETFTQNGTEASIDGYIRGGSPEAKPSPTSPPEVVTPGAEVTAEPTEEPPDYGCTLSLGDWKAHPEFWPLSSMTIGGISYNKSQLLSIMNTPPKGDSTYVLASQLIAAKLNIEGADSTSIASTIAAADAWLIAHPLGTKPKGDIAKEGDALNTTLNNYNMGRSGPRQCTTGETPTQKKKVRICHSTSSHNNAYNDITVSINSVENANHVHGHANHEGGIYPGDGKNWGDIIPPFDYGDIHFPGLNWTTEGQSMWANGCQPLVGTPEPTASPTPVQPPDDITDRYDEVCLQGPAADSVTNQPCTEGYYGKTWEYKSGQWWLLGTYCMTREQCKNITPPEEPPPPCVPTVTPSGFVLECDNGPVQTWNLNAKITTSCPINKVNRVPYPRTLVNVETHFTLDPPENVSVVSTAPQSPANLAVFVDEDGNPNKEGYKVGVWKNLVLSMRSRRFNGGENWFGQVIPPPQWAFADRTWNIDKGRYPSRQSGTETTYVYRTTSAGLNTIFGRGFDVINKKPSDNYNLAAYGVSVETFCGHEWKSSVMVADRTWNPTGPCDIETRVLPNGKTLEPAGTSNEGCEPGFVSPGEWTYGWVQVETPWAGINMKEMGEPVSYDVRSFTRSGGFFKNPLTQQEEPYTDEPAGVWVPVVEVQSVLRDECVANGTCDPPKVDR